MCTTIAVCCVPHENCEAGLLLAQDPCKVPALCADALQSIVDNPTPHHGMGLIFSPTQLRFLFLSFSFFCFFADDLVVSGAQGCSIMLGLNYKYLDGRYKFGGKLDDFGQVVNVDFNSRNWFFHNTAKGNYYLHWASTSVGSTWVISRTNPTLSTGCDVVAWYADPPGFATPEFYNVPKVSQCVQYITCT